MSYGESNAPEATRSAALDHLLKAINPLLNAQDVTELCVNGPGVVFIETNTGWARHEVPEVTETWAQRFMTAVAAFTSQRISDSTPLLSGTLPKGERIQIASAPAVERGSFSFTIRKPSLTALSRQDYEAAGLTSSVFRFGEGSPPDDQRLSKLYNDARYWDFFEAAVVAKKNIVIAGATGSGKTTFAKTIVNYIPPHERIVTIEDVREMHLPLHENKVHLIYSEGGQGVSKVSAKELMQSALRMKPDRILLAEIRSKVAYDYVVNVSSGHPGSITTVHADSAAEAFEMLMLRVKESDEGRELSREDILNMLRTKIDIVIQLKVLTVQDPSGQARKVRRITEIHYDPTYRHKNIG